MNGFSYAFSDLGERDLDFYWGDLGNVMGQIGWNMADFDRCRKEGEGEREGP